MTNDEILKKLRRERDIGSRFPSRIIFIESFCSYLALIPLLKNTCDVTINIADYAKKDVVPQFDKLRKDLDKFEGKQVLLLSVGEYLRFCVKRELNKERSQFLPFWESMQRADSKTRYIIPMFSCRDYFDRVVGEVNERQADFIWNLDGEYSGEHFTFNIYSPQFSHLIESNANNFEEWLRNWECIVQNNFSCDIITNQYRNAEETYGNINIKIIDDPFAYLSSLITDSNKIDQKWGDENFWANLIPVAQKNMSFSDIVLYQLNVTEFDFISVIARWKMLNTIQRDLIWLWYRVYPTDNYFSYACRKAECANEIPDKIRDEIISIPMKSQEWISERQQAMRVLAFTSFDDKYFKALDDIQIPEIRLQLLTFKTHEEQAYAIKTISLMLRNGAAPEGIVEYLKQDFPSFATYLSEATGLDSEVDNYFAWYRKQKIINRFSKSILRKINFSRFDSRFKVLHNNTVGKGCYTLWIDGFGVEWLPVFIKELEKEGIIPETRYIAVSILPTETEYNHQWDENNPMEEKWTSLDSLSHKGILDDKGYFSCIAYQLTIFSEIAKYVNKLLDKYEYVAVTGDHGSSRLAALAFHDDSIDPIQPPPKSIVHSHGRFCELDNSKVEYQLYDCMEETKIDDKTYIVMNDYNHFKIGGNVAGGNDDDQDVVGETHGGNTPEERLVPVVIIKSPRAYQKLTCKPKNNFVTCNNGHVIINLIFNRNVETLNVSVGLNQGKCSRQTDGSWDVTFDGISGDEISLSVIANNNFITDSLVVKIKRRGIGSNKGGDLP